MSNCVVATANRGLIVTASALVFVQRDLIVRLAAQHKLPAVYRDAPLSRVAASCPMGLLINQYRRAAGYVDRILNGEKPADLPVQAPTR
jgi:putative tryptophan/tyrosine transport system substrate-binding protein